MDDLYLDSRSYKRAMDEDGRRRKADAYWTALMARRAARVHVHEYDLSFNRGYMEGFGRRYRGKQRLTEDEKAVVDAYHAEGESALRGEPLAVWTAPSPPPTGWVSCIVCNGLMPAGKVEFTKPMPSRDLFVFYHATCFDSLTALKSLQVHERLPPPPQASDGRETPEPVATSVVLDWDLDKPCDGYDV
eukprot:jgi/Mesvir1/16618/Mv10152-RA.1